MNTPQLIRSLEEALSQRQFWDFYAVFANGLEDVEGIDVDHIVDSAWKEIFAKYVYLIFDRLVRPGILKSSGLDGNISAFVGYSMDIVQSVRPNLRKFFVGKSVQTQIAAIEWFLSAPEFQDGEGHIEVDDFTSSNGVWRELAVKTLGERKYENASRSAKAQSVDRMLAWSHHSSLMADYVAKWLGNALNRRAYGNMNTLLSNASPDVRDALKSAQYGLGRPAHTAADDVHIFLNRSSRILRTERNGNAFRVLLQTHKGKMVTEFSVTDSGLVDCCGDVHPFEGTETDDMDSLVYNLPSQPCTSAEVNESLDAPYYARCNFQTEEVEDDEAEEEGMTKTVLSPVQMVKFLSDDGTDYLWYARQGRFDPTCWEIAFGTRLGLYFKGAELLDIKLTNKHDAMRVLATVVNIINAFIDFDEGYEVRHLTFSSKGDKRTNLYLKRIVPRIENFTVDSVIDKGGAEQESEFVLSRTY